MNLNHEIDPINTETIRQLMLEHIKRPRGRPKKNIQQKLDTKDNDPLKRKRGRPPKYLKNYHQIEPINHCQSESQNIDNFTPIPKQHIIKKLRGRPKKYQNIPQPIEFSQEKHPNEQEKPLIISLLPESKINGELKNEVKRPRGRPKKIIASDYEGEDQQSVNQESQLFQSKRLIKQKYKAIALAKFNNEIKKKQTLEKEALGQGQYRIQASQSKIEDPDEPYAEKDQQNYFNSEFLESKVHVGKNQMNQYKSKYALISNFQQKSFKKLRNSGSKVPSEEQDSLLQQDAVQVEANSADEEESKELRDQSLRSSENKGYRLKHKNKINEKEAEQYLINFRKELSGFINKAKHLMKLMSYQSFKQKRLH